MPPQQAPSQLLVALNREICSCQACGRLVSHREQIGIVRRRAYRTENYWSRPVPGFGDPHARLVLVGLAPGAHGANRTGRMFTGDRSGDFLYRALFETGFANQPVSTSANDGLELKDAYITAAGRCAPPDNKPNRDELQRCRPFLARELTLLTAKQVIVVLGGLAMDSYLSVLQYDGHIKSRTPFRFGHGAEYNTYTSGPVLIASYHPSQQNTSTRRLTADMLRDIFARARSLLR